MALHERSFVITTILTVLLSTASPAEVLYSIDTSSDQLVRVDSITGIVTPVGPNGSSLIAPNLTAMGSSIFATSVASSGFDLFRLDVCSGAVVDSVRIDLAGETITVAEGLADSGGSLVLAFRTNTGSPFNSNTLGDLSPDGTLANPVPFDPDSTDMDALAANSAGTLYGSDTRPPVDSVYVFVAATPPLVSPLGVYTSTGGVSDMTFSDSDRLYGYDDTLQLVIEFSPVSGLPLAQVPLAPPTALRGLAFVSLPDGDGNGIPDDCETVGVEPVLEAKTWGRVKASYR